ncbi:MAG TPA: hypothetical protein VEL28_23160 [Candidatus Binatia bacterium]|nr:hypothetical protein [Candidatus Binatia bacterium]
MANRSRFPTRGQAAAGKAKLIGPNLEKPLFSKYLGLDRACRRTRFGKQRGLQRR